MALRCATQSLLERWTQCQELDSIPGLLQEEYFEQELERVAMCVCMCAFGTYSPSRKYALVWRRTCL